MAIETIESIDWLEGYYWSSKVPLGTKGISYEFSAVWNTRNEAFEVTIKSLDGEDIISGRKMIMGVDLLESVFSPHKPDCTLVPLSNNAEAERIIYDAMTSGEVRLYHLTKKVTD